MTGQRDNPSEQQQQRQPTQSLNDQKVYEERIILSLCAYHFKFKGRFFLRIELILWRVASSLFLSCKEYFCFHLYIWFDICHSFFLKKFLHSSGAHFEISWAGNSVLNLLDNPKLWHKELVQCIVYSLLSTKPSYIVTSPIPLTIIGSCSADSGISDWSDKSSTSR